MAISTNSYEGDRRRLACKFSPIFKSYIICIGKYRHLKEACIHSLERQFNNHIQVGAKLFSNKEMP